MREVEDESRRPRSRAETIAAAEIEWFYTRLGGEVPEEDRDAAVSIGGWLRQLATFHTGALSLRYTPKQWSASLMDEFGPWTSLIVRLECATRSTDRPADTGNLESAAVVRLEGMLADEQRYGAELTRLDRHAFSHVR